MLKPDTGKHTLALTKTQMLNKKHYWIKNVYTSVQI